MYLPADCINTGVTLLAAPITNTALTLSVTPGTGALLPTGTFPARLGSLMYHDTEVISCQLAGVDTFVIARAINGGTSQAWGTGTVLQPMLQAPSDDVLAESVSSLFALTGGYAPMTPVVKGNVAAALATSGTIATAGLTISRVNPAGAVTGVILQPGTQDGQLLIVENDSAYSVTFAASGSNVADGASDSIAATVSGVFSWNATALLWYRMKAS